MIVPSKPFPSLNINYSRSNYLDLSNIEFFGSGRKALLAGLTALGLKKGDSILVPAYICESAIRPLQAYGFKLIFVDIDNNLSLPINKISKIFKSDSSIMALITVHYYGITSDINELSALCRKYNVKVVEDASHSFMTQLLRDRSNINGDIEIFSMRKNVPVLDGGALRMNNAENLITKNDIYSVSKISSSKFLILRLIEKLLIKIGINIYAPNLESLIKKIRNKSAPEIYSSNFDSYNASKQLSRYLGNKEYLSQSQLRIVGNFNKLSNSIQNCGLRLFLKSVEINVIPQACVVHDDNGGLVDYLRLNGIGAWQWPHNELPQEVLNNPDYFPNAILFEKKLVLLPIHKDITDKHIQYINKVIERWTLHLKKS
tara:strand:- start:3266 stop:4384 length:1119 start_codon:yes stop_codon:yes gene_type:complete